MTDATYPAVVVKLPEEEGGGFAAYAPDLPGCMSDGQTDNEALNNLRLAIGEWCDEANRLGRDIPPPGSAAKAAAARRAEVMELLKSQTETMDRQQGVIKELSEELDDLKSKLGDLVCFEANVHYIPRFVCTETEAEMEALSATVIASDAIEKSRLWRN